MTPLRFTDIADRLQSLTAKFKHRSSGLFTGVHSGTRKGYDDELTEMRSYSPGDDLRYLDWKYYARADKLTIRHGFQNAGFKVAIVLDTSISATIPKIKAETMRLTAMGMAWLLYSNRDKVRFFFSNPDPQVVTISGKHTFPMLDDRLILMKGTRESSAITAESALSQPDFTPDKIIWFTDLYEPFPLFQKTLRQIAQKRINLVIIHTTSNQEWKTPEAGLLARILDSETGEWLGAEHAKGYQEIWEAAIQSRYDLLTSYGFSHYKLPAEDGPLKFLHGLTAL